MTSVTIDQVEVGRVQDMLGDLKEKYKSVMVTSINKTLTTANTQAAARIGNKVSLTAKRIKQDLIVKKANYSDMSGSLKAYDEWDNRIGLIQYGAKQTNKGVTVKIKKASPRFLIPHAFIATGKNSKTEHVFWRANRVAGTGRWPVGQKLTGVNWAAVAGKFKTPLSRRVGPSVAYWFGNKDIFDPVAIQAQHLYLQNIEAKVDDILRRHRG